VPSRIARGSRRAAAGADPLAWLAAAREGSADWEAVATAAASCKACPLWRRGTGTVFGEGPRHARLVLVGEQPGDREDLAGRPFVGPAGKLLDRALAEAGLRREEVYLTNAVKHFKWKPSGKRRLHEKPSVNEARACQPWLLAELEILEPDAVVCLGATAARSLLGPAVRVTEVRGEPVASPLAPIVMATIHPSSLLRLQDPRERREGFERFVGELAGVARRLAGRRRRTPRRRAPGAGGVARTARAARSRR
jgi:DNA polymerase